MSSPFPLSSSRGEKDGAAECSLLAANIMLLEIWFPVVVEIPRPQKLGGENKIMVWFLYPKKLWCQWLCPALCIRPPFSVLWIFHVSKSSPASSLLATGDVSPVIQMHTNRDRIQMEFSHVKNLNALNLECKSKLSNPGTRRSVFCSPDEEVARTTQRLDVASLSSHSPPLCLGDWGKS